MIFKYELLVDWTDPTIHKHDLHICVRDVARDIAGQIRSQNDPRIHQVMVIDKTDYPDPEDLMWQPF